MLICSVSLRSPRRAISSEIAEVATAVDATATGLVVFATLVDDPASVGEIVDAYLGEIMLEAASASEAADAGLVYAGAIDEAVTTIDAQDATATSAVATTNLVAGERSVGFITPVPASVSVLESGTLLTVQ